MATPAPTQQQTPPEKPGMYERINWDTLYTDLADRHGVNLNDDEKKKLQEIVAQDVKDNGGDSLFGANPVDGIGKIFYMIFKFLSNAVQNLGSFDAKHAGDWFSAQSDTTMGASHVEATFHTLINVREDLIKAGADPRYANLAHAATVITGVSAGPGPAPEKDAQNLYWQMRPSTAEVPEGTPIAFNRNQPKPGENLSPGFTPGNTPAPTAAPRIA